MKRAAKCLGIAVLALVGLSISSWSHAGQNRCGGTINWTSDTCATIVPIELCKWNSSVDTVKIHNDQDLLLPVITPYKFVDHMSGPDNVCFIQFHAKPSGQTANDYARAVVKRDLNMKGISGVKVTAGSYQGRNRAMVTGYNSSENSSMSMWAWRNRKVGVNLQCFCQEKNCNPGTDASFQRIADSIRFVSEEGCIENR